jgi:hypothetical protein
LLSSQDASNSGWGTNDPNRQETAYALIGLATATPVMQASGLAEKTARAIHLGREYLLDQYAPNALPDAKLWVAKEIYSPYRVDRIYELCAMLMAERVLTQYVPERVPSLAR